MEPQATLARSEGLAPMAEYVMIVVYVPVLHTDGVRCAMCDAGAGTVDDGCYDHVVCVSRAACHYRVLQGARAEAGQVGQEYQNDENRIEAICRRDRVPAVVQAICAAHPYETPAIAIYPTLTGEFKYWRDAP
jgi:hypothetical protein